MKLPSWAWPLIALGLLCLAPWFFSSSSSLTLLSQMGIAILICQSFQLLWSQGGMLSFGHAIYVGAGSFLAIHSLKLMGAGVLHFPVILVPLLGGLAGLLLAVMLGWITTRKAGTALAMISLGLGELVWSMALMWPESFGGEGGLSANRVVGQAPWGLNLASPLQMYGLIATYTVAGTLLLLGFVQTPMGRLLNAVRDNAERVAFLGYNPHVIRYGAFLLAGFIAGVAGGLAALNHEIFTTDMLHAERSGSYLLFTILGGSSLLLGPLMGGVLMVLCLSLLSTYTPAWMLYVGVLFMGVVMFVPGGLSEGLRQRCQSLSRSVSWHHCWVGGLRLLAAVCVMAGMGVLIEMAYHLPQLSVLGPQLTRMGWVLDVQDMLHWWFSACMVLMGTVLHLWLRHPQDAQRAKEPQP
jgi:branched-chain amino acid transport system permease protein